MLALHRHPENNFTDDQTWASLDATLRRICQAAAAKQVTVHLRLCRNRPPWNVNEALEFLTRVGQQNLRLAPSTEMLLAGPLPKATAEQLKDKLGIWMVSTAARDTLGRRWGENAPIAEADNLDQLASLLAVAPDVTVVLDAVYGHEDAEYLDARTLDRLLPGPTGH